MIEALHDALRQRKFAPGDVKRMTVATHPRWLKVCDIKGPRTGLEVKFSYAHLAAMAVSGMDTSSQKTYTDALARSPGLIELARRVEVAGDERLSDTAVHVLIELDGGMRLEVGHDLAERLPMDILERGLRAKARGLLGSNAAKSMWAGVAALDHLSARDIAVFLNG
jgi:hypothetical protein